MNINKSKELIDKNTKVIIATLKISCLAAIVVLIPLYIYFYHKDFLMSFENFNDIVTFLEQYKLHSIPIYISLQILQIVISVIPGQVFQLAAGYLYTFFPATLFSIIGAVIGTTITFYLASWLGSDFIHMLFGKESTADYVAKLNSKRAYSIVFLLYLIPGLPKDVISYAAGISEMKYKPFIIISTVGRLPGMMGSIVIGSMWHKEEYFGMLILGVLAVVSFITCIICRKKIQQFLDKAYNKLNGL